MAAVLLVICRSLAVLADACLSCSCVAAFRSASRRLKWWAISGDGLEFLSHDAALDGRKSDGFLQLFRLGFLVMIGGICCSSGRNYLLYGDGCVPLKAWYFMKIGVRSRLLLSLHVVAFSFSELCLDRVGMVGVSRSCVYSLVLFKYYV